MNSVLIGGRAPRHSRGFRAAASGVLQVSHACRHEATRATTRRLCGRLLAMPGWKPHRPRGRLWEDDVTSRPTSPPPGDPGLKGRVPRPFLSSPACAGRDAPCPGRCCDGSPFSVLFGAGLTWVFDGFRLTHGAAVLTGLGVFMWLRC